MFTNVLVVSVGIVVVVADVHVVTLLEGERERDIERENAQCQVYNKLLLLVKR